MLLLLIGMSSAMAMAGPIEIKPVLQTTKSWTGTTLPGFNYGQTAFSVLSYNIAPGAKTPIHTHPMNGVGYILSGELTMYATEDPHGNFSDPKKVKKITLHSGQAWTEAVNTWHYGENTTNQAVKFIVVFGGSEKTPPTLSLQ